jgi:hypothetical protein
MMKVLMVLAACAALAGCAGHPETASQQADDAACTAQADAGYNQATIDEQARTSQNGLLFAPTPNHVFDAERLGAEHTRDSEIARCEANGAGGSNPQVGGVPVVTPHIIGTP